MRFIRVIWQCDILSRHRMSICYDKANYQEALDNLRKLIDYRKFVKHCQVEHNIIHDILSQRYDVI